MTFIFVINSAVHRTFSLVCFSSFLSLSPRAEVFHSKESALRLAFPDADRIEQKTLFVTTAQKNRIETLCGASLDSQMVTVYLGRRAKELLGYAFLDTHTVRTMPETFMVVLDTQGRIRATHVLAFHEPPEYLPAKRWLRQFEGRKLDPALRLGGDIVTIAGSSLTSEAVTSSMRRILALYEVLLQPSNGSIRDTP